MSPKRILGLAIAASAALASSAALAATGTPERVRGTIASATADSATVDTHAHKPVVVALTGNTSYLKVEKSNLNEVEKGSYIAAGIALAPAAFAEDMKKDSMSKDSMSHDSMAKDAMKKDSTAKDTMTKDGMSKDSMSKDNMKK
jgi:pentapeptide MXKDX repeat protein